MSEELTIVTHYGLHTSPDGIAYLHQGRKANNFLSMKQPSPFTVRTKKSKPCPHLINPASTIPDRAHWSLFLRMMDDDLVREMLPIPKERNALVPFLADPNGELMMDLVMLSRLGSPILPVVVPFRKMTPRFFMEELSITNALPLVLTSITTADQADMEELARESRSTPRKLILVGSPNMVIRTPMKRITTDLWNFDKLEMQSLNMENIGAAVIRRHARGEKIDADFIRD